MKDLKERISEVSQYLQRLMAPAVLPDVQEAVEKKDKDMLVEICKKNQIPETYRGIIPSILLSVGPDQPKWPTIW